MSRFSANCNYHRIFNLQRRQLESRYASLYQLVETTKRWPSGPLQAVASHRRIETRRRFCQVTVGLILIHASYIRHLETGRGVAAATVLEGQVAAKGRWHCDRWAALSTPRSKMLKRLRRTHLAGLWQTCRECMAIGTSQSLSAAMFRMAERITKGTRVGRSSRVCLLVVTNSARGKFPSRRRFTVRRMAGVALDMGRHARGNRERRGASTAAAMAGRASTGRPRGAVHMLRVIEFDVETFIKLRREILQRRVACDVRRTDNNIGTAASQTPCGQRYRLCVPGKTGVAECLALVTGSTATRCVTHSCA